MGGWQNIQSACKTTTKGIVRPFGSDYEVDQVDKELWFGPKQFGCCMIEVFGPLQIFFWLVSVVAFVVLVVEIAKQTGDEIIDLHRYLASIGFFVVAIALGWFAKLLYILKIFRAEIGRCKHLNARLEGDLTCLELQSAKFEEENLRYQNLNDELRTENEHFRTENDRHARLNHEASKNITSLAAKVVDLQHVERQLAILSKECAGSVQQARSILDRLERNTKLGTVNTIFLFFDRCDTNKDGLIDEHELELFVEHIDNLFKHLEGWNRDTMKSNLLEKGGLTISQVHTLVDIIMLEDKAAEKADADIKRSFPPTPVASEGGVAEPTSDIPEPGAVQDVGNEDTAVRLERAMAGDAPPQPGDMRAETAMQRGKILR
mmetsp:Transcript_88282/g.248591  ORF Transcript_88282/g.248591 Transcript_88282/m.248591 type:complete len:376 (-) Transcript_88282:57-1184(-)